MNHVNIDQVRFWSETDAKSPLISPYSVKTEYVNDSPMPVRVASRDGFKVILQPNFDRLAKVRQLKIRVTIAISADIQQQFLQMFNTEPVQERRDLIEKAQQIWSNFLTSRGHPEALRLEYVIGQQLFAANNGTLYVKELDLAFTHAIDDRSFCHPSSIEAGLNNMFDSIENPDSQYVFSICIVDNAQKIGPRWVRDSLGYSLINPVKSDKLDGFYILHTSSATSGIEQGYTSPEYHESEETLGFKLYKSWHEAANADPAAKAELEANDLRAKLLLSDNNVERLRLDRELMEQNARLTDEKYGFERDKLIHERDQWESDCKLQTVKYERELEKHQRDIDRMTRDTHLAKESYERDLERLRLERDKAREAEIYEGKNHVRKTIIEVVKMIGTVITGIFSILLFILKLRTAKA